MLLLIVVLTVGQTVMSNRLSTTGVLMSKIEEEIHFYKVQNSNLSEKLLKESSLSQIVLRAERLGFVDQGSRLVLTTSFRIVSKP